MPTTIDEQAAHHQSLFRDVNERVYELISDETLDVLCECADLDCTALLRVKRDEYDEVRSHPARFLVRPDHTVARVERVVSVGTGHVTVEKLGLSGRIAAELGDAPASQ